MGGNTAKIARNDIEKKLGKSVINDNNMLSYKYIDDNLIESKE